MSQTILIHAVYLLHLGLAVQVSVSDDKAAQIQYIEQMWAKLKEILADFLQGGRRL